MADSVDFIIAKIVDDIWQKYDADNSGALDREETKAFMENTLKEMSPDSTDTINDEDFDVTFKEFDKDNSGSIERGEMAAFIKKVSGLQ